MKKFTVGMKVRFIDEKGHKFEPRYYPAVGTIGTVIEESDDMPYVRWPRGSTSENDCWFACDSRLEIVNASKNQTHNFDELSPEVSRALKDLFSYVERVNVSRKRSIYIDYTRAIPGMICLQEWDKEKREFTLHETFHATRYGGNIVRMIEAAHVWLSINHPANDRCGTHVYYARLSFRCPDVACLIRTTTRSALVAAREIGEGAEIVEIQSLHGRVLDIAKKRSDGTYKRLK